MVQPSQLWLALTNALIAASWATTLFSVFKYGWPYLGGDSDAAACSADLGPVVNFALWVSFLELFNAVIGLTRSPILAVLLFSCTRMGVELLVAPLIPCASWQHLLTVSTWALGDTVRFGCFFIDTIIPGLFWVKSIRFTVGRCFFLARESI